MQFVHVEVNAKDLHKKLKLANLIIYLAVKSWHGSAQLTDPDRLKNVKIVTKMQMH